MFHRRHFLQTAALAANALALGHSAHAQSPPGFRSLFDGQTLAGWMQKPRLIIPGPQGRPLPDSELAKAALASTGRWEVRDGIILGGQSERRMVHPTQKLDWGFGGWLMTEELFGDFELLVDAHPDWPCDTGIYVRTTEKGEGFQVLLDHRGDDANGVGGSIGFIYCKAIGNMRVDPNNFRWELGPDGLPKGVKLVPGTDGVTKVDYSCTSDAFREAWRMNDWNTFRIRVVGQLPRITTWINNVKICECDTAKIEWKTYDPLKVNETLGPRGHIALEVHDGPANRWGIGKVARWRNILVKELRQ